MPHLILATCFLSLFFAYPAFASDIWILDCEGKPLFAQHVNNKEKKVLSLKLGESRAAKLLLVSQDGKTAIEGRVENNIASFEGLQEGSWRLCTPDNASIQAVDWKITDPDESDVSLAELGLGGAAVGLAAVGFSLSDSGKEQSSEVPNELSGHSGNVLDPASQQTAPQASGSTSAASRGECFVGDEVVPMSPFM